jgi:hypothetical protein
MEALSAFGGGRKDAKITTGRDPTQVRPLPHGHSSWNHVHHRDRGKLGRCPSPGRDDVVNEH